MNDILHCVSIFFFFSTLFTFLMFPQSDCITVTLFFPIHCLACALFEVPLKSLCSHKENKDSIHEALRMRTLISLLTWTSPVNVSLSLGTRAITEPGVSHFSVHPQATSEDRRIFYCFFLYRPWLSVHEQAILCEPCVLFRQYVLCTSLIKSGMGQ